MCAPIRANNACGPLILTVLNEKTKYLNTCLKIACCVYSHSSQGTRTSVCFYLIFIEGLNMLKLVCEHENGKQTQIHCGFNGLKRKHTLHVT